MAVRHLTLHDYDLWLPIWDDNMEHKSTPEVTMATWERLCDDQQDVYGLGQFQNGVLKGILHYVLHPTTGALNPVCYMQDLYVDPAYRRQGVAKSLLKELALTGKKQGWERIYWLAAANNKKAQSLYKNIGVKLDFSIHILPLNMTL